MTVLDSSCWMEYFAGTSRADLFADVIKDVDQLVVPTVTILEVFRKLLADVNENAARRATAQMAQGEVADLTVAIAVAAACIGRELKLPLADSIILATARAHQAELWTQDAHFENVPGVKYFRKK